MLNFANVATCFWTYGLPGMREPVAWLRSVLVHNVTSHSEDPDAYGMLINVVVLTRIIYEF